MSLVNATRATYVVVGAWNGKPRPFGEAVHLTLDNCSDDPPAAAAAGGGAE